MYQRLATDLFLIPFARECLIYKLQSLMLHCVYTWISHYISYPPGKWIFWCWMLWFALSNEKFSNILVDDFWHMCQVWVSLFRRVKIEQVVGMMVVFANMPLWPRPMINFMRILLAHFQLNWIEEVYTHQDLTNT